MLFASMIVSRMLSTCHALLSMGGREIDGNSLDNCGAGLMPIERGTTSSNPAQGAP
jgi:hypothetical protein